MSAFLVLYGGLFILLVCVFVYVSTRGAESGQPDNFVAPLPEKTFEPVASPVKSPVKAPVQEPLPEPVKEESTVNAKAMAEQWRAAHADVSEVEAFAHTKTFDENAKDPRVGSKLRAAKQRGTTVQATMDTVQKMLLTPAPAPAAKPSSNKWESYLQEKAQDRLRQKQGTPFIRCNDGSYTSEYQRLLSNPKSARPRVAAA